MSIAQNLDSAAPTWAQQLFDEFQVLREEIAESRRQNQPPSLRVGTAEAAIMLNKAPRTIREWHRLDKMPKPVSKENENLAWNRADIEKMCRKEDKGGRRRRTA